MAIPDGGRPNQLKGAALAVVSAVFAAVFLIAFRVANASAPREATVLVMLAGAALLNGGFLLTRVRRAPRRPSKTTGVAVLVLGALSILGNLGVAGALGHLDPGITSTILQTQVFVVGIGAWWLLKEAVTRAFVLGACFAFLGFVVLGVEHPTQTSIDPVGVLFGLLASVSFGAMLLYTRKVISEIDPVTVNVGRLVLAVLAMGAYLIPTGALSSLGPEVWLATGVAALCGPFISRLCLMYAVKHISASQTKLLTLLTPIFAFVFEAIWFGSLPSVRELVGGGLILAGVVLPELARRRAQSRSA